MLHARSDYQGIQDTTGDTSILPNEPVFLLRAKDPCAAPAIRGWAQEVLDAGGDPDLADHARDWADKMEQWRAMSSPKKTAPDTDPGLFVK